MMHDGDGLRALCGSQFPSSPPPTAHGDFSGPTESWHIWYCECASHLQVVLSTHNTCGCITGLGQLLTRMMCMCVRCRWRQMLYPRHPPTPHFELNYMAFCLLPTSISATGMAVWYNQVRDTCPLGSSTLVWTAVHSVIS